MREVNIKSKFIAHISYTDMHIIKYEYLILKSELSISEEKFYSETSTEKINEFEFGKSETIYYFTMTGKTYNSIHSILKSKDYELIKQ